MYVCTHVYNYVHLPIYGWCIYLKIEFETSMEIPTDANRPKTRISDIVKTAIKQSR